MKLERNPPETIPASVFTFYNHHFLHERPYYYLTNVATGFLSG